MFVVLSICQEDKGPLARGLDWLRNGTLTVERKSFLGNGYYLITDHTAGRPHWERLAKMAGRAAAKLVVAGDQEPPPGCGLGLYQPSVFYGRLTAMAGVQALKLMGEEGRRGSVGLVDEEGLFGWCAGELARQCALLRVYTRRPDRYQALCRELMEGFGASLVLADSPGELAGCLFAVSPAATGVWKLPMPVFTVDRSGIQGGPTINRLEPELPPDLLAQIPRGAPVRAFLGTAWETGLRRFPLDMGIRECRIDGRRASLMDAAVHALLRQRERAIPAASEM